MASSTDSMYSSHWPSKFSKDFSRGIRVLSWPYIFIGVNMQRPHNLAEHRKAWHTLPVFKIRVILRMAADQFSHFFLCKPTLNTLFLYSVSKDAFEGSATKYVYVVKKNIVTLKNVQWNFLKNFRKDPSKRAFPIGRNSRGGFFTFLSASWNGEAFFPG